MDFITIYTECIYSSINLLPLLSSVSGLVSATWTSLATVAAVITSGGSVTLLQATGSVYTCQVSCDLWRAGHVTIIITSDWSV